LLISLPYYERSLNEKHISSQPPKLANIWANKEAKAVEMLNEIDP
jgi:hypothetical protein